MKYYYISITWRRNGHSDWHHHSYLIDKHPIEELMRTNQPEFGEDVHLLFWEEVTKEIYDKYWELIG